MAALKKNYKLIPGLCMRCVKLTLKCCCYLVARCFYKKKYCNSGSVPLPMLISLGFMQRIVGFNRSVPWPVHHSSLVNGWNKIESKYWRPYPGFMPGQYIQAINGITIGKNVRMGPGVKLISANHDVLAFEIHTEREPIEIGDNCWLSANAIILPGVKLGNHVVVAAGAVVTKNFSDNCLIAGVPAKFIRHLDHYQGRRG